MNQLEARTTARGMFRYANDYYVAYELVQATHPKLELFEVKFYLLCHSLELAMKSVLRHRGESYPVLKNTLGHDLEAIMNALISNGMTFVPESQEMIVIVNLMYSAKEFEYALNGAKTLPEITELARLAKAQLDSAKDVVMVIRAMS